MDEFIKRVMAKQRENPVVNSPQVNFLNVTLSQHTIERYIEWKDKCYARAVIKQKEEIKPSNPFYSTYVECWEAGLPYEGALGGGITFELTPSSLGYIIKARYDYTNDSIDLTEYDLW